MSQRFEQVRGSGVCRAGWGKLHLTAFFASATLTGITTFLAMAYILPVNSGMLSLVIPGKREQLVCATALASFCGCWLMGILSNYPFMLAPGVGCSIARHVTRVIESIQIFAHFPNHSEVWVPTPSSPSRFAWDEVYHTRQPSLQYL